MPADDVSDLRDVVDAINRLCDTMKTSHYDDAVSFDEIEADDPPCAEVVFQRVTKVVHPAYFREDESEPDVVPSPTDTCRSTEACSDLATEIMECIDVVSPEEVSIRTIEVQERWSDSLASLPVETVTQCEPASEMYYTASSEVSLLSDTEGAGAGAEAEDESPEGRDRDDRKECVIAGHVAAMRERFESMTRTNTPCPDLVRSSSPSLDVFRNITPSPDRLG